MPQFTPADRETVKKNAEKAAKSGDVFEIGDGLVYVRRSDKPFECMRNLTAKLGWYVDTVYFDETGGDEHAFVIMPVTEVR